MRIGPSFASVPDINPLDNAFATAAPARVAVIFCLLLIILVSNVVKAVLKLPPNIESTALLAPVDCANEIAVPASIADILNVFFALRLGALRLGAITIQLSIVI